MKKIKIVPGIENDIQLELGEEYKLEIDQHILGGEYVNRTTINIKMPDGEPLFVFDPLGFMLPMDGETFECKDGVIPDSYIPNIAKMVCIKNICFDNLYAAIHVMDNMNYLIDREYSVSIATFNRLIGDLNSTKNDKKHGWSKGDIFKFEENKHGRYEIKIPAAHYFGEKKTILDTKNELSIKQKMHNHITCPHCGFEYNPSEDRHSVVHSHVTRIRMEPLDTYFDAWNCPLCGGQYLGRDRLPESK